MAALQQMKSFEWPSAGSPRIHLSPEVAAEMARRVSEAANALPRRGLEVGGLLLGKKTADEIEVTSLVPVQSGYPEGPAFRVDEADLRAALQSAEERGEVVGIYRSRTDGRLDPDHQDEVLLRLLAREPVPVLLIRQQKDAPGEGRLLIWAGSGVKSGGPAFPLKGWLAGTWEPVQEPVQEPVVAVVPRPPERVARVEHVELERRKSLGNAWGAAAALAVLVVSFAAWRVQVSRSDSARGTSPPPRLVLESVPAPSAATPAAATPPVATPAQAATTEPTTRGRLGDEPATQELAKKPEVKVEVKAHFQPEVQPGKQPAVRSFQPPPTRAAVPQQVELPRAGPGPIPVSRLDLHNVQAPPLQTLPSGVSAPQVVFTQPVLAHQPRPVALPPDLRRLLQNEVVLSLRIAVDANGRVSEVYSTALASKAERSLWSFYADAVRNWVFEPARRDNVPVAGETILRFRVSPNASR